MLELYKLAIKKTTKIEFEDYYIVYHYDNFKFYLIDTGVRDEISLMFYLEKIVKEYLEWKINLK